MTVARTRCSTEIFIDEYNLEKVKIKVEPSNAAATKPFTNIVSPENIVKEGWIYKRRRNYLGQWVKRYAVLAKDYLVTYQESNNSNWTIKRIQMDMYSSVQSCSD